MKSDQNMQLSKMWQTFAVMDLSPSCKIYGRSGMMQSGIAYQLPPLVRLTRGIASGSLPTPTASDASVGRIIGKNDQYKMTKNGTIRKYTKNGVNGSLGLGRYVKFWPTPTARANQDCPSERRRNSPCLETAVKTTRWPTPTAQGRWASEGQISQLRKNVDAGKLTVEEAEQMIEGTINPPRMKNWPTPTARDYKDTGKLEALAKYSHKKRLACSVAQEEISGGE